ncbi:MAG: DNA gyrase C-terminal beta-propeller domain-containing protein, partial [Pseudomonadales bacterium]
VQVFEGNETILISDGGTLVRIRVADVSRQGRNTQGVRLIKLDAGENLVGMARVDEPYVEEGEFVEGDEEGEEPSAEEGGEPSAEEGGEPSAEEGGEPSAEEGGEPSAEEGENDSESSSDDGDEENDGNDKDSKS